MSGPISGGNVSEVSGSGTSKDPNARANLARYVQKSGRREREERAANRNSMLGTFYRQPAFQQSAPGDVPAQDNAFNRNSGILDDLPEPARFVTEATGTVLMTSVSLAILSGALTGIPDAASAVEFLSGEWAEIMDVPNEELIIDDAA